MKRFVIEYANYKIKCIEEEELIHEKIKNEKMSKVYKLYWACDRGMITIDECMKAIAEV